MFIEVTDSDNNIIAVNIENILYIEKVNNRKSKCIIYFSIDYINVKDEYDIVLNRIKETLSY